MRRPADHAKGLAAAADAASGFGDLDRDERVAELQVRVTSLSTHLALARSERDALAAELTALRRVVRGVARGTIVKPHAMWWATGADGRGGGCDSSLPAALRAAGDEPGALAVEAALKGGE